MSFGKEKISLAEWKAFCANRELTALWDDAGQTGAVVLQGEHYQARLTKLSAFAEAHHLKDFDAAQCVKFLNAYHTHFIGYIPSDRTGAISAPDLKRSELREFYSLLYHLLPEDGVHKLPGNEKNAWRSHIQQFFDALQLGGIQSESESAANLQKLAEQGAQYTKKRHGGRA